MNVVAEHRLRNDPAATGHLGAWVADFAQRAQLSTGIRHALDLALEECVTNVISYAWSDGGEHWVTIRFLASHNEARIEIEDDGREFDPLTVPAAKIAESLETRAVGGLGVHMVRQLMDAVEYRREKGHNVLTLVKRTAPANAG
jgi:anti-sigma regulatory factor (Ser/Thr protein kinase)